MTHPEGDRETDEQLGRLEVDDEDLAAFFAGEDLSVAPVTDGGKGLIMGDPP